MGLRAAGRTTVGSAWSRNIGRGWDRLASTSSRSRGATVWRNAAGTRQIAVEIARRSVAQWLDDVHADDELRATTIGLRGFFLADPEELSLIALVDQFSSDEWVMRSDVPDRGRQRSHRNDTGSRLGDRVKINTELVAVSQRGRGVRATVRNGRHSSQVQADYAIFALPASLLRRMPITPALPVQQHEAISARCTTAAARRH